MIPAHREVLSLRHDIMPRRKVEHRVDSHRRADRRTRDAALLQDQRKRRDRYRFRHDADNVQPAIRRGMQMIAPQSSFAVTVLIRRSKLPVELPDSRRVFARYDVVRPETLRFIELVLARRECCNVAAEAGGELHGHIPTPDARYRELQTPFFAGRKSTDGPVGCQGRERSVQDRGFVWRFIGPRRPDPGRFGFSGECRPKEAVGSGSRTGWEGARPGIRRPFGIGRMAARAIGAVPGRTSRGA